MDSLSLTLCHFCDIHGPRILMSTQVIHGTNSTDYKLESQLHTNLMNSEAIHSSCNTNIQRIQPMRARNNSSISSSLSLSTESTCDGCSLQIPHNSPGYVTLPNYNSSDKTNLPVYLSKQFPTCKTKLMQLKRCCDRAFSFEQTASKEGTIVFGDATHGFAISKKFYLKDSKARGLQRLYCLILFTRTKLYLYRNFTQLSSQLESLADFLKHKAEQIFATENQKSVSNFSSRSLENSIFTNSDRFMLPNNRLRALTISSVSNSNTKPRSLCVITGNENIYKLIHEHHAAILSTHIPKIAHLNNYNSSNSSIESISLSFASSCLTESISSLETPSLYLEHKETFVTIRHFARTIGEHIFSQLIYHLYIGNQIIIKSDSNSLVSSAIEHLATLLPEKCVNAFPHENHYVPHTNCNLLGVSSSCHIPNELYSDINNIRGVILEIFPMGGDTLVSSGNSVECDADSGVGMMLQDDQMDNYVFQIQPDILLLYYGQLLLPTVLTHLSKIIYPKLYSETVMKMSIQTTKESITTKAKALHKYCSLNDCTSDTTRHILQTKLLNVLQASPGDMPFLNFWAKSLT